jgi:hypothetical protein
VNAKILKSNPKLKIFKGMVLKLVRIEPNRYVNGKSETFVVLNKDESEVLYPMMWVELVSEARGTK